MCPRLGFGHKGKGDELGLPTGVRDPGEGSSYGVYKGAPEPAIDRLWAGRALLWGSEGVSIR